MQVVLDLDETLVCAYETSSLPAVLRDQATEAGLKWFELECISSDKVSCILIFYIALFSGICYERTSLDALLLGLKEIEGKPKVNYVTVFERPGLHEFLKQLSEFADLVLFTAGLEGLHLLVTLYLSQVSVVLHHSYFS